MKCNILNISSGWDLKDVMSFLSWDIWGRLFCISGVIVIKVLGTISLFGRIMGNFVRCYRCKAANSEDLELHTVVYLHGPGHNIMQQKRLHKS